MPSLIREWIPVASFIVILITALVTVLLTRDGLRRFEAVLEKLTVTINQHGERLASIEATCRARCERERGYAS
jgi:hypothetical protein